MLVRTVGIEPSLYVIHGYVDKVVGNFQARGKASYDGAGLWNSSDPLVGKIHLMRMQQ